MFLGLVEQYTPYSAFYRNWNLIVHDWLHTYIYKDVYAKFHSRSIAPFVVFLISAIFHEYILAFAFRFFYPITAFGMACTGVFS